MDYQLSNISLLKKLSLISVLSTNVTESNLMSGGIFTDVRTSLYSRMLETVKKKWEPLALSRFLPEGTMPDTYLDWVYTQLLEYKDKDMYLNPTYINETTNNIFRYTLEPEGVEIQFLYYNLSYDKVLHIMQRLPHGTKVFPCRYSMYIQLNIDDKINELNRRENESKK